MRPFAARRTLASYVPPRALAPGTRAALEALGYRLVPTATQARFGDPSWQVDARLVDERHLDRLPRDGTPVLVLSSGRETLRDDPRIVGAARRPANIAELYPLLQRALEPHPRSAARVPARISARCTHADRRWGGELVTLSQAGCLLETSTEMPAGMELNLLFPLPLGRMVSTRARVQARSTTAAGLAFQGTSSQARDAIGDFVQHRLATLHAG